MRKSRQLTQPDFSDTMLYKLVKQSGCFIERIGERIEYRTLLYRNYVNIVIARCYTDIGLSTAVQKSERQNAIKTGRGKPIKVDAKFLINENKRNLI